MTLPFNPFDHPIVFQQPRRLSEQSYWQEHIPFGMLLVTLLKPRILVELGTHYGDSYCAFCQAVQESQSGTRCYAVDNWAGDVHVGEYGSDVLAGLRAHHDPLYGGFSTLLQSDFAEALKQFKDGEIDLLHIDGTHTYEAVKLDYENWLPKMSERGVILFHDTNVLDRPGYEVRRFFDEVKARYPHFEFLHGYGLGVLLVGREAPAEVKWLTELDEAEVEQVREYFAQAGQRVRQGVELNSERARRQAIEREKEEKERTIAQTRVDLTQAEKSTQTWQNRYQEAETFARNLEEQLQQISSSKGWAIAQRLWRLKRFLARIAGRPPARLAEPPAESQKKIGDSVNASNILLNLDAIRISNKGAFCLEGWVFNYSRSITNLQLVVQTPAGEKVFDCIYGLHRPDVLQIYQAPQARHAGFSAFGNLGTKEVQNLFFKVTYADGEIEIAQLPDRSILTDGSIGQEKLRTDELLPQILLKSLHSAPSARDTLASLERLPQWDALSLQEKDFTTSLVTTTATSRKVTLIFDHNLGGGANSYRIDLIERLISQGEVVLFVYYNIVRLEYNVQHLSATGAQQIQIGSLETLESILSFIKIEAILVNNLYSYEDPFEAIQAILRMKELTKARLMMVAQDFECVCPEINLVNKEGNFCGVPDLETCRSCLPNNPSEHLRFLPDKDISAWRESWGRFLGEMDEIICGSNSTISLIRRAYPWLDEQKFKHRPYAVDYLPSRKPVVDLTGELHLGVVGNVSSNKGVHVVEELADLIAARNLPVKITVIGSLAAAKPLPGVKITGAYCRDDLPELIEWLGVNVCLFPSIWPETFSYVTQELMILGLPLAVFNLGAPAERVAGYERGLILSQIGDANSTLDELIAFHRRLRNESITK